MTIPEAVALVFAGLVAFYIVLWICAYGLSIWAEHEEQKAARSGALRPAERTSNRDPRGDDRAGLKGRTR